MPTKDKYRDIHLLFLIMLLLQLSNAFLMWMPQFVRMILNQLLFVFLPAYLYLRITRQPIRERIRWTWPGWKVGGLALLIGMALYPLSAVSHGVLQQLLGYTRSVLPDDALPNTALMGILAIVAFAIMAPLCEEFMFRGVIQPVHERRGPTWGVFFVGGLFIVFHLYLIQGLSIIPLALALGFVNYRARSLPASILTHFGANALASLVMTNAVFPTGAPAVLFSTPVLIGSPIVAVIALVAFARLTRSTAAPSPAPHPAERPLKLAASWPLLIAAGLYVVVIGVEVSTARAPQLPIAPLQLQTAVWQDAAQSQYKSRYEIRNPADEVVGEGECVWQRDGALIDLTCTSTVTAYEVRIGKSIWSSGGGERRDHFRWRVDNGNLVSGQTVQNLLDGAYYNDTRWTADADGIHVQINVRGTPEQVYDLAWNDTPLGDNDALPLLNDYAAPWQLAAINPKMGTMGQTARFHPSMWRPDTQNQGPVTAQWLVIVTGRERIQTPAGAYHAWKVMFGNQQTVWLDDSVTPALPVQFFNGIETWALKENH